MWQRIQWNPRLTPAICPPHAASAFFRRVPLTIAGAQFLFDLYDFDLSEVQSDVFEVANRSLDLCNQQTRIAPEVWTSKLSERDRLLLERLEIVVSEPPAAPPSDPATSDKLTGLEINVAQICNLGCDYCCVGKGDFGEAPTHLTQHDANLAIEQLIARTTTDSHEVTFFGGEPMLNFEVIKATVLHAEKVANLEGRTFQFRILSNGTAFTRANVDFLKRHNIHVQVSLDGSRDVHDKWRRTKRGNPTHGKIVRALERFFGDAPHLVTLRATLTKGNLNAFRAYQNLQGLGLGIGNIIVAHANGHFQSSTYSKDELQELKNGYTELAQYFLETAIERNSVGAIGAPFNEYLRVLAAGTAKSSYCGAGTRFVGLSARGGYYFCQDLAEDRLAATGDLQSGLDSGVLDRLVSKVTHVDQKSVCGGCWARYQCGGGCAALALSQNRKIDSPYLPDCELIRHNVALAAWISRQLQVRQPTAFLKWLGVGGIEGLLN
jgi:uncharacterized protein